MRTESNTSGDLDLAVKTLHTEKKRLVLVKDGKVLLTSEASSITPYVQAINALGESVTRAALADRTIGRAAALLSIYAKIASAYAETISDGAIDVFSLYGIPFKYGERVPVILNRRRDGQCPYEQVVSGLSSPEVAFRRLVQAAGTSQGKETLN